MPQLGDLITAQGSPAEWARLSIGATGNVLNVNSGGVPAWTANPQFDNLGLGVAVGASTTYGLRQLKTFAYASGGEQYGYYSLADFTLADTGLKQGIRIDARFSHTSGTGAALYGGLFRALASGSGGTVTDAIALRASVEGGAGTTITLARGLMITNPSSGGTITQNIGLYMSSMTAGATNWAIYSLGGNSYHDGNIGLGTTDIEAWDSGFRAIESYGSSIMFGDATRDLYLFNNLYYDGAVKRKSANVASYIALGPDGYIYFCTVPTGTADSDATASVVDAMVIQNSGNIEIEKDVKITGDLYTVDWTDYLSSSTIGGFTGSVTGWIRYKKIGDLVFVIYYLTGTSNDTYFNFTLPYTPAASSTVNAAVYVVNAGTASATPGLVASGGTTTFTIYRDWTGLTWTNSGTKASIGEFFFRV